MRVDQLTAAVRPRSGWEAMDLGLRLLQQHAATVYRPWFLVLLPLTVLLTLICWVNPMWAAAALWWLKPLLSRIVLIVLGGAVFGSVPNTLGVLQQWWRLAWRDSWRLLTIGRLHPARSFRLPVRQLEQLSGSDRNRRLNTLSDDSSSGALWFSSLLIEWSVALLFIGLTVMIFGNWLSGTEMQWEDEDTVIGASFAYLWLGNFPYIELWQMRLLVFLYALRISIIEPFFTAAGFGLYLNRRTVLEGWDIELQFRRIAARLAGVTKASAIVLLAITLPLATPNPAFANDEVQTIEPASEVVDGSIVKRTEADKCAEFSNNTERLEASGNSANEALAELLKSDDWKPCELATFRRWNNENEDDESNDSSWSGFELPLIGAVLEPLIWALAIGGILLLAMQAWRWRDSMGTSRIPQRNRRTETQRSKITLQHTITGGVLQNAEALWQTGQHREALSLLYRGALQKLDARWQLELEDSFTEAECQRHISAKSQQESLPELSQWFNRLTLNWQRLAWGHKPPSDSEFFELSAGWQEHMTGRLEASANEAER